MKKSKAVRKAEFKAIRERVSASLKKIRDAGWVSLMCDNYGPDHFLKNRTIYQRGNRTLCTDCAEKES